MDKVCIIAEAGVNNNGRLDLAYELCDAAKKSGADIVKFQTIRTDNNTLKQCEFVKYQKENVKYVNSAYEMLKKLELTDNEFLELKKYCGKQKIEFLSTPSEISALNFLVSIGMNRIKLGSGDITNIPFLRKVAVLQKKIILSVGMATLGEIEEAVNELIKEGAKQDNIVLLHCHSAYPSDIIDINLKVLLTLKQAFGLNVGLSDHTLGIEVDIAAVALGAVMIEKHFTLNNSMQGPDHKMSLNPDDFSLMVNSIRNVEKALGNGIKKVSNAELELIKVSRKCIVAARHIAVGDIFTKNNLTVKRPCLGINASKWDHVIGRKAKKCFDKDEVITF